MSYRAIALDFRFTFDSRGKANICPHTGSRVYGVVYRVSTGQMRKLDGFEGVRSGVYRRFMIGVMTDSREIFAITYGRTVDTPFRAPIQSYLDLILTGLAEHGYPQSVISEIRTIAHGQP